MVNRILAVAFLAFSLIPFSTLFAQNRSPLETQVDSEAVEAKSHVISVGRSGSTFAKPDVGILTMSIHSTSPIAEEAVAENERKAKEVASALAAQGFSPTSYKITSVIFGQAGRAAMYDQNQPEIAAYQASQYVYVFFEGADLSDPAKLAAKSASVMEALRKAGAVPASAPNARMAPQGQGGMIVYAVKNSDEYENDAVRKGFDRARGAAYALAKAMEVQITGVRYVKIGFLAGGYLPYSGMPYLESLPYHFYSTRSDQVEISASTVVQYDFK
ncbi:MAG: SIMPL domain-containing protein [Terriglobia bacterium]|jgi:uncharacterized protein YggE